MLDRDTFLTALYVFIDDYVQTHPTARRPGPAPHLSPSEVLTLLVFSRWRRFASERDFYRYARRELLGCFTTLPDRSQFVRQVQHCSPLLTGCLRQLARQLGAEQTTYQVLDLTPVPVRDAGPGQQLAGGAGRAGPQHPPGLVFRLSAAALGHAQRRHHRLCLGCRQHQGPAAGRRLPAGAGRAGTRRRGRGRLLRRPVRGRQRL